MKFHAFSLLLLCTVLQSPALAWDSVGHRLSAAVALSYLSTERQELLREILSHHPRYQADFIDAMPASVQVNNSEEELLWLLGQAAYWPDIARGFPEADAARFNHPAWHFIDGVWVRDGAATQGNVYVLQQPFSDVAGAPAATIRSESQADNVMTALDYNTRVLADRDQSMAERAVALCWVLHLMGDIHQPLHAGSLFSPNLFASGDRGGNAINTDDGNLHARWDRALAGSGFAANLETIRQEQRGFIQPRTTGTSSDWSQWLAESRNLLRSVVYSEPMKTAITTADQRGTSLPPQRLDQAYVENMERLSRQRLGLAGLRIAIWIENAL